MTRRDVIVVGLSAGGFDPLRRLVTGLPADLGAAMLVVQHVGTGRSVLADLLAAAGPLRVTWATDGECIEPSRIYVAPPDRHLLVKPGRMRLFHGPRENCTRPAADPLFRSAAFDYGPRVVGIILSGRLSDGTAGFAEIKRRGGITIVQDPEEAECPGMPLSALLHTTVDHRLPAAAMADLLAELAGRRRSAGHVGLPEVAQRGTEEDMAEGYELKPPFALTCPHCGGAVSDATENSMPYYACHIGHRFGAADFDEAQFRQMEMALETALRALNERSALCGRMAAAAHGKGFHHSGRHWDEARDEANARADVLRRFVERGWRRPDPDAGAAPGDDAPGS